MAKLFDKDGNEVEAFTEDELKEKQQEAIDKYKEENPDKASELEQAQKDLEAAKNKLKEYEEDDDEGGDDKGGDGQKKRLKKERDEALEKVQELEKTMTEEIKNLKQSAIEGPKSKLLNALSGGDEELKKKIELEYDGFAGDPENAEAVEQRLTKAYTLATGNKPTPELLDGISNGGNRGVDQNHINKGPETENSKAMRNVFGITDQDVEKYGKEGEQN